MNNIPPYWKTSNEDVLNLVTEASCGKIVGKTLSAGNRPIHLLLYGKKNDLKRTANLSSALGAGFRKNYADKTDPNYRPTVLLVGCIHGGEFEGTMALLNLINILEKGVDLKGDRNDFLCNAKDRVNILIIPCLNPDGRSRVDFHSFVGKTLSELRYYNQGTWNDGTLCGWPECKLIHPMKGHCKFMGAYFNDDGVNMMHDNFFGEKASETQFLFDAVESYSPDFTILLHGGLNTEGCLLKPSYAPDAVKECVFNLEQAIEEHCIREYLPFCLMPMDRGENNLTPSSFNLVSALYHLNGEPCVTYESNQGLVDSKGYPMTHDEIYRAHMVLFEETIRYIEEKEEQKRDER